MKKIASKTQPTEKTFAGSGNVLCIGPHVICSFSFATQAEEAATNLRAALRAEGLIAANSLTVRLKEDES